MRKAVLDRLTYANVVATLALILAAGGGAAFAANQLGKNTVGAPQLKKNAVTAAKIKNKAVTGAKVNLGTLGKVPSAAHADEAGKASDASKLGGVDANRYVTASSVLASGQTETGVFAGSAPGGSYASIAFDFVPKLPHGVPPENAEILGPGTTSASCPGRGKATAGHFCVYEAAIGSMAFPAFAYVNSGTDEYAIEPEGAVLLFESSAATGNVRGNWAYTAP